MGDFEFGSQEHIDGLSREALESDFRYVQDRRMELEDECERLDAENAKLFEAARKWMAKAAHFEAENAKLRELVADMWRFTGTACKKYPRLFDPAAQGGQMVQPNMLDSFEQRMRELGIEVPE